MKISDFTEKSFIKNVLCDYAITANNKNFDDCVIIDLKDFTNDENSPYLVYSIDHPSFIKRPDMSQKQNYEFYGRWAAACTCGDVLAMGAKVKGFSMDLSMPLSEDSENIKMIYHGIQQTLKNYSASFEGGNIDINNLETVCMAWGIVDRDAIIKRAGANEGDYIFITGTLGIGWSNQLAKKLNISYDNSYKKYPMAPINAMEKVFEKKIITSGMDLTDGVIEFLYTIVERNGLGVTIDLDSIIPTRLQCDIAKKLDIDPRLMIFEPGYDTPITHGWTVPKENINFVKKTFDNLKVPYMCIGRVTSTSEVIIKNKKKFVQIPFFCDDQFQKNQLYGNWLDIIRNIQKEMIFNE